jgi:hypothetical protein
VAYFSTVVSGLGLDRLQHQALIQHTGQRVDVCAGILLCSGAQPLGGDVQHGANRLTGLGQPGFIGSPGDPEINQIREVVLIEQDVGRFDITVQQTDLVGGQQLSAESAMLDPLRAYGFEVFS